MTVTSGADTIIVTGASADFISEYAKTDPMDDFADSFEEYFVNPNSLRRRCRAKYDFMHVQVFVGYWLRTQRRQILDSFDAEKRRLLGTITTSANLRTDIQTTYADRIGQNLESALTTLETTKVAEATPWKARFPRAVAQFNGIRHHRRAPPDELQDIVALPWPISDAYDCI